MANYNRVLVGTDGSASSYRAVDRAASVARAEGAQLLIVSAYRPIGARDLAAASDVLGAEAYKVAGGHPTEDVLREATERATADGKLDVDTFAVVGDPVDVLINTAKEREVDLLVVGNRGINSLTGRLLGSVPSVISHRAACDVLIVDTT